MRPSHPLLRKNCENCGTFDDLEYYEHVFKGITLCGDCADLPMSKVSKYGQPWVIVDDEYYPRDIKSCKNLKH